MLGEVTLMLVIREKKTGFKDKISGLAVLLFHTMAR